MKKIVLLVMACVIAITAALTPAVIFMNNRYSVIQFHRDINMKFLDAAENGYSVRAENNGTKYTIAAANYDRLCELLTYSKVKVNDPPETEGKDTIVLQFYDGTRVTLVNYDEENDIVYVVCEENGKATCYEVTKLNLYYWVNEVVDEDGFRASNKILP